MKPEAFEFLKNRTMEENWKERYDDLIERLKVMAKMQPPITKMAIEGLIPELKESEDEKWIPKEIANYLKEKGDFRSCWIAWLEKQKTSEEALQYLRENHSSSEMSDFQAAMNIAVAKAYDKGYSDGFKKGKKKSIDDLTQQEAMDVAVAKCFEQGEQKPAAWSEEDVLAIERIIDTIQCAQSTRNGKPKALYTDEILDNLVNWLKSLKNRTLSQSKQEWSEEDENLFEEIKRCVGIQYPLGNPCIFKFLKSLKDRYTWKPSEEQMEALEKECFAHSNYDLCRLLEDLKKLKG